MATCQYDSGSMDDCRPLCSRPATHVVVHQNGSYGPFNTRVCEWHVRAMQGRAYPGHIRTDKL